MNFSKVAQNDARSLKIIGCIFLHLGGGGSKTPNAKFSSFFFIFLTLYRSLVATEVKCQVIPRILDWKVTNSQIFLEENLKFV